MRFHAYSRVEPLVPTRARAARALELGASHWSDPRVRSSRRIANESARKVPSPAPMTIVTSPSITRAAMMPSECVRAAPSIAAPSVPACVLACTLEHLSTLSTNKADKKDVCQGVSR